MTPCRKCDAKCCRYFALQIDTPGNKNDFENIRWYIAHKGVRIFVEKRKWYLEIRNDCHYLAKNGRCRIYDKRPLICREHSVSTCENVSGDFDHVHVFKTIKDFDVYLERRFKKKK